MADELCNAECQARKFAREEAQADSKVVVADEAVLNSGGETVVGMAIGVPGEGLGKDHNSFSWRMHRKRVLSSVSKLVRAWLMSEKDAGIGLVMP
jgi:hypothetical protein